MRTERCLIHFHIPRTGGTWLRRSLIPYFLQSYSPDQIFFVDGGSEWGCSFGSYEDLQSLSKAKRTRLRFVTGHMPSTVFDLFDDAFTCTIVREPIERALSDYWYCYHSDESPAHSFAKILSPGEFCRHGYSQSQNGQTRYLSGAAYSPRSVDYSEMLTRAEANLGRFDLVGVDSNMNQFLKSLPIVGVADLPMSGDRHAKDRLSKPSCEDLALIRQHNLLDYRLYERAQRHQHKSTERVDSRP